MLRTMIGSTSFTGTGEMIPVTLGSMQFRWYHREHDRHLHVRGLDTSEPRLPSLNNRPREKRVVLRVQDVMDVVFDRPVS